MKASGVTITQPDLGPFVAAVRPAVWNQVMGRIPKGKELIEQVAKEADYLLPKK
jgi:hypothetical protein